MKRVVTLILVVLCSFVLFTPAISARAASEVTVQITESQLNKLVHLERPVQNISNITFEVQEGRLAMIGLVVTPPTRVVVGILGAVDNGRLVWTVMGASANDRFLAPDQLAAFNAQYPVSKAINDVLGLFLTKYGTNLYFTSLTLSNHTITVGFTTNGGPATGSDIKPPVNPTVKPAGVVPAGQGTALTNCSVTSTTDLNLRADAGPRGAVITVVPLGTTLAATSRQGNWYYVNFQGSQGWLNTGFLKKTGACR